MNVHIATDHAGMELSAYLVQELNAAGYMMVDHGPRSYDADDDYPAFCIRAAQAVVADQKRGTDSLGIVLGGSGNGEQIAANKVTGVRAALVWNKDTARLAREHNDANIISIGARQHSKEEALEFVKLFLEKDFSEVPRHERRIYNVGVYEETGEIIS